MPASAPLSVTPSVLSSAPVAVEPRAPTDAGRAFDRHLTSARQQRDGDPSPADAPPGAGDSGVKARDKQPGDALAEAGADSTVSSDASTEESSSIALPAPAVAANAAQAAPAGHAAATTDGDEASPDTASVASAMLALLGQAMPTNASAATGGAAKVLAACVLKASTGPSAGGQPVATSGDVLAALADADAAANGAAGVSTQGNTGSAGAFADLIAAGAGKAALPKSADGPAVQDLATLLGATPQATSSTGVMPPHALQIASPAGSPAFAQELGQQVVWLGNQDLKQAKIRLHPEELGQLDVKVSVQHNGQVDVTFAAQHPAAVHALQQTLPQLDALLAQQGLSLGQAQVGQQSSGGGDGSRSGRGGSGGDAGEAAGDEPIIAPVTVSALGMLDTFA